MLAYDIVDVFSDRPFAGNQLAIVHGAEELNTEQCLAIAREFNFSETTFPSAVEDTEYATRIFTPAAEIPFAGHPTLGTAWALRSRGSLPSDAEQVTQFCGAGRIGVRFADEMVELTAVPRDLLGPLDEDFAGLLLGDLGLDGSDLTGPAWVAGCGLSFVHLPVLEDAVARAHVTTRALTEYAGRLETLGTAQDPPADGINLVHVAGTAPPLQVHSRVFVPGLSVPEDPATGSAAAGLGMALAASGLLPDGGRYEITQGVEMGRPSRLLGRVEATDGVATVCHVAGQVHPVASGHIAVPPPAGG